MAAQPDDQYLIKAENCAWFDEKLDTCEAVVIAPSGLKLREQPDFRAKTVATLPFGKKVKCLEIQHSDWQNQVFDADSIAGVWRQIFWQGKVVFAFSAYLGDGILKMTDPFYLLLEKHSDCWDDAFISAKYHYYGVFPNADTTILTVKKLTPTFFYWDGEMMGGITFSFRQPTNSIFAFASTTVFPERQFSVTKNSSRLAFSSFSKSENSVDNLQIPRSDWELTSKKVQVKLTNQQTVESSRLILRDKKTGAWQFLTAENENIYSVYLDWAGDFDGDGKTDFLIQVSDGHSTKFLLFVSKNAGKRKLVRLLGKYFDGDCC